MEHFHMAAETGLCAGKSMLGRRIKMKKDEKGLIKGMKKV